MLETLNNDAYLQSCECPNCRNRIGRNYDERTFYCEECGTQLHQKAFSEKEIEQALFDREIDDYEE